MTKVTIEWEQGIIKFSDIKTKTSKYLDNKGFYAIITGKFDSNSKHYKEISLRYIGMAFDQTVRERVQQKHDAYIDILKYLSENPGFEALVMVGCITKCSQDRITKQLMEDIEACLIFRNKPKNNIVKKYNYAGRSITINNTGDFRPLKEISDITEET